MNPGGIYQSNIGIIWGQDDTVDKTCKIYISLHPCQETQCSRKAQCFKLKFLLVAQKCSENFPLYIIYYNFYLPMVKFNWSSPIFGHQGWPLAGGGRVRNAGLPVITGNTLLAVACEYCRRAPSDFGCLRGSRVQPRQGSDSSRRARDTAATMLDHSRHRGESATKTVKFFATHTVNCVICKNLTRIEWMPLNFTPVIQQNCHQPGRNFEKSFCAVDMQVELSKSETTRCLCDPESSGTIRTLPAPTDSTGTIKRVCWHKRATTHRSKIK